MLVCLHVDKELNIIFIDKELNIIFINRRTSIKEIQRVNISLLLPLLDSILLNYI